MISGWLRDVRLVLVLGLALCLFLGYAAVGFPGLPAAAATASGVPAAQRGDRPAPVIASRVRPVAKFTYTAAVDASGRLVALVSSDAKRVGVRHGIARTVRGKTRIRTVNRTVKLRRGAARVVFPAGALAPRGRALGTKQLRTTAWIAITVTPAVTTPGGTDPVQPVSQTEPPAVPPTSQQPSDQPTDPGTTPPGGSGEPPSPPPPPTPPEFPTLAQVGTGESFSCALDGTGQAFCWGSDIAGQLGDAPGSGARSSPVPVTGGHEFTTITAGNSHACALDRAGTAWCWGNDTSSQLGDGPADSSGYRPIAVPGRTFSRITAGSIHTCALDVAGAAWCWGANGTGRLGDGTTTSRPLPVAVSGARVYSRISAGGDHTCALEVSGAAWCWGSNSSGQLGEGKQVASATTPVAVSGGRVFSDLDIGLIHSCAIDTGGQPWCWGSDVTGQLEDGSATTGESGVPVAVATSARLARISAGSYHTCGLDLMGVALCWGQDAYGALGDGPASQAIASSPVQVAGSLVLVGIDAGAAHTCARQPAGTLWCWGNDGSGQAGDGPAAGNKYSPVAVAAALPVVRPPTMASGADHTCALDGAGAAWCWGSDSDGQIGDAAAIADRSSPVAVAGDHRFVTIAAGAAHTCALDTSGKAWCWGQNTQGQLGTGDSSGADATAPVAVAGDREFVSVTAGSEHTCALAPNSYAFCWGLDKSGQVGDGLAAPEYHYSPLQLGVAGFASIAAGGWHTCALKASGAAWCWGRDVNGQVGDGGTGGTLQLGPVAVAGGNTFYAITAGSRHTCALDYSAALRCWGLDASGQVGDGAADQSDKTAPALVAGQFAAVAAGAFHTCALDTAGAASCWGSDSHGSIGDGAVLDDQYQPTVVATPPTGFAPLGIIAGGRTANAESGGHTCGVTVSGEPWCWGYDFSGQVGDGPANQLDKVAPTAVAGSLVVRMP